MRLQNEKFHTFRNTHFNMQQQRAHKVSLQYILAFLFVQNKNAPLFHDSEQSFIHYTYSIVVLESPTAIPKDEVFEVLWHM